MKSREKLVFITTVQIVLRLFFELKQAGNKRSMLHNLFPYAEFPNHLNRKNSFRSVNRMDTLIIIEAV